MNNSWNRVIYKFWSPFYDRFFNSKFFLHARKEMFKELSSKEKRILFVGVGTGADLEQIDHENCQVTAIDYSPHMLREAQRKFPQSSIEFMVMDAQQLSFEDESFDLVIGSLILSVVPDSKKCFDEMIRVTKKNGQLHIFDKFIPQDRRAAIFQKFMRPIVAVLGTDIGLRFEDMIEHRNEQLRMIEDVPVLFKGMYRKIVMERVL